MSSAAGACCGFLISSAVPIAMIVVSSKLSISKSNLMLLKVGAQYINDFDGCSATG